MAERASPLAEMKPAASAGAAVTLRRMQFASILQVSAWPDTVQTVESVIREVLGVAAPQGGLAFTNEAIRLAAIAPGRILIAGQAPDLITRFEAALPSSDAAVTDLSHGRVVLRLEGDVEPLLARVVAIDFHPKVFPAGRVAQTIIDHVDVAVHRLAPDIFELWTFRSFTHSVTDWLLDAGLETGTVFSD